MAKTRQKKQTKNRDWEIENILLCKEQVVLAKERTALSFIRTGLAFIGAGVVLINIFPNFNTWLVGIILIIIGFFETLYSYSRLRLYQRKMDIIKKEIGDDSL